MFGVFNRISLRKHLRDFWWLLPVNWSFGAVFGTQFSDYFSTVWEMPEKHVWIPRHSCGRSSAEKWSLFCNEHPSFPCLPFRCPNNQHNSEAKSLCLKSLQTVKPQYDYCILNNVHQTIHLLQNLMQTIWKTLQSFPQRSLSPQVGNPNWPDHLDWKVGHSQNHSSSLWLLTIFQQNSGPRWKIIVSSCLIWTLLIPTSHFCQFHSISIWFFSLSSHTHAGC